MRPRLPLQLSQLAAHYDLDDERADALERLLRRSGRIRRGGAWAWEAHGRVLVQAERYGSLTAFDPSGTGPGPLRPLFQVDRHGHLAWAIARDARGRLVRAKLRAFDGRWIGIRRAAGEHPLWGASDAVVALQGEAGFDAREVLTIFRTVDYERLAFIPPLDRPSTLPPGAGIALLNLLAILRRARGGGGLRYRGPYATEQLFETLLLSFHPWSAAGDPRSRFTAGAELRALERRLEDVPPTWRPAPHERACVGSGIEVLMRQGAEAVYWRGRTYRAASRGRAEGAHAVVPRGNGWCAGFRLLGEMVEEHVHLNRCGEVVGLHEPPTAADVPGPCLGLLWREAVQAALVVRSPSLLVATLRRVFPEVEFRWAQVPGDLVRVQGTQVLASTALLDHLQRCLAQLPGREARLALAARAVGELLDAMGAPVRRMAQAWLETLPLEGQLAMLSEGAADTLADTKAQLAAAFPALCAQLVKGGGFP